MSEFICYLPQIVTTLLVHYTPDIKFLKKLGKLERPIETPDSGKRNGVLTEEFIPLNAANIPAGPAAGGFLPRCPSPPCCSPLPPIHTFMVMS